MARPPLRSPRLREQGEVVAWLLAQGYVVDDIRAAPDEDRAG